ncbi:MAG: restriction endonuclease subunit S [Flavobacteriaceae bacterium]|nr:restriction endonuclease subunit S [Flavobacteriaceae bacterium]
MEIVELEKVCEVIAGQSPPSSSYNEVGNGMPFFQGKADFGKLYPTVRYWCTKPKKIAIENDILFSVRAPVGSTNINNIKASIGRGLSAIRCSEKIDVLYLLHYLRANELKIKDLGTGSTFKAITIKTLKSIKIPLPPLTEQKRIAKLLDTADKLREQSKKIIEKYDELTQSLFLEMFGDPITNPKCWEKVELEEVTNKIGSGATPKGGKKSYKNKGISLIRSLNVHDNYFKYKDLAFIDEKQAEKLNNVIIEENDVLFNITGASVARCCIVPNNILPARVNQHVSIIRCKQNIINPIFIEFAIISENSKKELLGVGSNGGTREAITKEQLEKYLIPIPPIALQEEFAERVKLIEKQKAQAEQALQKSEELFCGLLQGCFKG